MARKKKDEEVVAEAVVVDQPEVVLHLDVDPNDPRNRPATNKLPSLDDEGQS